MSKCIKKTLERGQAWRLCSVVNVHSICDVDCGALTGTGQLELGFFLSTPENTIWLYLVLLLLIVSFPFLHVVLLLFVSGLGLPFNPLFKLALTRVWVIVALWAWFVWALGGTACLSVLLGQLVLLSFAILAQIHITRCRGNQVDGAWFN